MPANHRGSSATMPVPGQDIPVEMADLLAIIIASYNVRANHLANPARESRRMRITIPLHQPQRWTEEGQGIRLERILSRFWGMPVSVRPQPMPHNDNRLISPLTPRLPVDIGEPTQAWALTPDMETMVALGRQWEGHRRQTLYVALDLPVLASQGTGSTHRLFQRIAGIPEVNLVRLAVPPISRAGNLPVESWRLLHIVFTMALATTMNIDEVRFFENGVTNLRLPITCAALAQTQAHTIDPVTVAELAALFTDIGTKTINVRNPNITMPPADVLGDLLSSPGANNDTILENLIALAQNDQLPHSRIDKNLALLSALFAAPTLDLGAVHTPLDELITALPQGLAEGCVRVVRELQTLSDDRLISRLAEGAGVPRQELIALVQTPVLIRLVRRHLASVRQVLVEAVARHAQSLVDGTLPPSCLLVRAISNDDPGATIQQPTFRRSGDSWEMWFDSGETLHVKNLKGLEYLHVILSHPNQEFRATDLRAMLHPDAASLPVHSSPGTIIDERAARDYKSRIALLRERMNTANDNYDIGAADSAKQEIEILENHLRGARDIRGRLRENTNIERARRAVSNAITRAIDRVQSLHPTLAGHLRRYVRLGRFISYSPSEPVLWLV